jgi:uncharacterized protein YcbK (DUF882 family)
MPKPRLKPAPLAAAAGLLATFSTLFLPGSTETAEANGDTRTISLYHSHTGESIEATFRVNGHYDPAVLQKLNWFLRDFRRDEQTQMDPRLFDVVWEAYRAAGADQPIVVYSAYRSPETNAMLRRRSHAVAEYSQHMLGKAMDTTMPGMSMEKIREIGMRLQRGGVGYYPSSNFVHLDVGSVRHWPRMSYDQLVRLFPDGKTVHLASNGRMLARYEEARAEIEANGSAAYVPRQQPKGLFAWLFGSHEDEDEGEVPPPAPVRGRWKVASRGDVRMNADADSVTAPTSASRAVQHAERNLPPATEAVMSAPNAPVSTPSREAASVAAAPRNARAVSEDREEAPAASVTAEKTDKLVAQAAFAPVPPHRPAELMAVADVPLPPSRRLALLDLAPPSVHGNFASDASKSNAGKIELAKIEPGKTESGKPDAIGHLIAETGAAAPLTRAANLPVVIAQNPKDQKDQGLKERLNASPARDASKYVLAYAPTAQMQGLRSAANGKISIKSAGGSPLPAATPSVKTAIVSARLDRSNFRSMTAGAATAATPTQTVMGPAVTGLRQAARVVPGTFSNVPTAGYVTAFQERPSTLSTDHFSGTAVAPLPAQTGFARVVDGSARSGD